MKSIIAMVLICAGLVVPALGAETVNVAVTPSSLITNAILEADTLAKNGDLVSAREKYSTLLDKLSGDQRAIVEEKIGRINIELTLTPSPSPEKVKYVIKSGDSLVKLAKANQTTEELLQVINSVKDPGRIRIGDRLWLFTGRFAVRVSKSRNDMVVTMNDVFFKRYRVGTGKHGSTPVGKFYVQDRMKEPAWWRPDNKMVPYGDKENILGTRWMSLRSADLNDDVKGYGIHGTWDETTIGQALSSGCIRMKNADVEELFKLLPSGTSVIIEE